MSCEAVRDQVRDAMLEGQAMPDDCQAHLDGCDSCSQWHRHESMLTQRLRDDRPALVPRPDLAAQILAQLEAPPSQVTFESSEVSSPTIMGPWAGSWVYLAAAAAVVLMLTFLGRAGPIAQNEQIAERMTESEAQEIMDYIKLVSGAGSIEMAQVDNNLGNGLGSELDNLEEDAVAVADFLLQCLPSTSLAPQSR